MCRWSNCSAPAEFTMVAHGDRFDYCGDHIRPAVVDFRLGGPPVEVKVVRFVG